ncbi:hypothetical protein BT96DRAFT_937589 [Gymnopus androsaceus JB14]|uniref:Uncharacterized protein n=1 Tax=Gymnopus androsaceus JB14 TaxID=1447944 RepID=A0A6A4HZ23_9AGAR|nr:hypothetical protein BT96DRAFT_937589 [Gymnopus androsaceus JB14]
MLPAGAGNANEALWYKDIRLSSFALLFNLFSFLSGNNSMYELTVRRCCNKLQWTNVIVGTLDWGKDLDEKSREVVPPGCMVCAAPISGMLKLPLESNELASAFTQFSLHMSAMRLSTADRREDPGSSGVLVEKSYRIRIQGAFPRIRSRIAFAFAFMGHFHAFVPISA